MRGERVRAAAAAVGALAGELRELPRVDVLLDVSGEHDLELGRDLARTGHGQIFPVRSHRDIAPALTRAFRR
jgi:hypothetical protein